MAQDAFPSAVVYIIRRYVAKGLVVPFGVVQLGTIRPTNCTIVKFFIRGTHFAARGSLSDKRLAAPDW
jgi:hypothetical protein